MRSGYQTAISISESALSALDPHEISSRARVKWDGSDYIIPWFNENRALSSGNDVERVLWLHYLVSEGTRMPEGRLVAYRELNGAGFYEPKFMERAIRPLVKRFGSEPEGLYRAASALGGIRADTGDFAVTLYPLPRLPVTYVLWLGDEELPPDGNILFDRTASGWLPAEDLTVLASQGTYKLIGS